MLKGKTKIELIDTRNGHIDTYEDTNMFTNGIQELLSYTSILDNNKFQSNINSSGQAISNYNGVLGNDEYPTINYFTGGLLLLQNYIGEDATTTSIPANNKVIGRACLENNSSTENGSRNGSILSANFNEKSFEYIWEFSEAQANGVVSCVSLTTPLGAVTSQIDDDDSEISYNRTYPYISNFYKCVNNKNGIASNTMYYNTINDCLYKNLIVLVDGTNNCYYSLSYANEKLTTNTNIDSVNYFNYWKTHRKILLDKYRFPYNNFSIFDDRIKNITGQNNKISSVEISIPNDIPDSFFNRLIQTNPTDGGKVFFFNNDTYLYIIISNFCYDIYGGNDSNSEQNSLAVNNDTSGQCFMLKINISTFTVEQTINLGSSNINNLIYSYKSGLKNNYQPYTQDETISGVTKPKNQQDICNRVNDIYVFNDKLYCFIRENIDNTNHSSDLVLCSINLNDFTDVKRVQFNDNDIVIHQSADAQHYEYEAFRGTHGTFENVDFPLGVPFVSMIADKNNLYITFLKNKKTFVINNSEDIAYILTGNTEDNPFILNLQYELSEPLYPSFSNYPYWNGSHPLSTIYVPTNELMFYIVGGNGKILKLNNKQQYGRNDTNSDVCYRYTANGVIEAKYYVKNDNSYILYNESGCYDIIESPTKLITINNLERQIEKKSYQKMKVTYTITEVLE